MKVTLIQLPLAIILCLGAIVGYCYDINDAELDSTSEYQLEEMVDNYKTETGIDLYQSDANDQPSAEPLPMPQHHHQPQPAGRSVGVDSSNGSHWEVFYDKDGILRAIRQPGSATTAK